MRAHPAAERITVDATDSVPFEQATRPARKGEGMTTPTYMRSPRNPFCTQLREKGTSG